MLTSMTLERFLNKFKAVVRRVCATPETQTGPGRTAGARLRRADAYMLSARAWLSCDITQWKVFASTAGIIVEWWRPPLVTVTWM